MSKKFRVFFKSMRVRLTLLFLLFGVLPMTALRIGMLTSYANKAVSNRGIDVLSQAKIIANQIVFHNYLEDVESELIVAQLNQLSNIYDGRIMVIDGSFQIVKDTYGLDEGKTIVSEEVMQSFRGEEISKHDSENGYIEMTIPLTEVKSKHIIGVLLVSVSTDGIALNQEYLESSTWIIQLASILVLLFVTVFITKLLTKPFRKMASEIVDSKRV